MPPTASRPALRPARWPAPRAPRRSRQLTGSHLQPPVRRLELQGAGPEDVVADAEGRLYAGLADGRILRISRDGAVEELADTGGRPLGLEVLPDGGLLICDEARGLLRLAPGEAEPEVLVDRSDGRPLTFASNVVATSDGTVYFTVSSQRYRLADYRQDLIEHTGTGRLVRRDPDGRVQVLLEDLQFANGLALSDDESYLLFAETASYSFSRYDLVGPHRGRRTLLTRNLPGFPDNVGRGRPRPGAQGLTWVAIASPRDPALDFLLRRPPVLRRLVSLIPESWQPGPKRTAWVLGIDDSGRIVHDLQAPGDNYSFVTGVVEVDGVLYLGSLLESAIGVLPLPE